MEFTRTGNAKKLKSEILDTREMLRGQGHEGNKREAFTVRGANSNKTKGKKELFND
jgi:hypothetical protein